MTQPVQVQPIGCCEPEKKGALRQGLAHAVWIVPVVAAFIMILFVVLGRAELSHTGRGFINALIYSTIIGLPSAVSLNVLGHRYSDRLGRWMFVLYTAVLVVLAVAGSYIAAWVLDVAGLIRHGSFPYEVRQSLPFSVMITLVVGLSVSVYETLRQRLQSATLELRTRQMEQERAYKLVAEARLSSLESRIHPHFLFNTLNSIAALIPRDPQRAEDTVGKLASLLRFSLTEHGGGLVSLEQELKIVRDYLEIESTRFGARLRYAIDVPQSLLSMKVPPLAVQCLAENAVKHVVAQRPEGAAIRIAASREDAAIRLQVIDDGPGFSLDAITPDHGLGNLVARIELIFGQRGKLDVTQRDGHNTVTLIFPADR